MLPYLLKKPSCTKYFASWLASPIANQEDYVRQLKKIQPKYILYDSPGSNFELSFLYELPEIYERLALVNSYILSEYKKHNQLEGYIILEKK